MKRWLNKSSFSNIKISKIPFIDNIVLILPFGFGINVIASY